MRPIRLYNCKIVLFVLIKKKKKCIVLFVHLLYVPFSFVWLISYSAVTSFSFKSNECADEICTNGSSNQSWL